MGPRREEVVHSCACWCQIHEGCVLPRLAKMDAPHSTPVRGPLRASIRGRHRGVFWMLPWSPSPLPHPGAVKCLVHQNSERSRAQKIETCPSPSCRTLSQSGAGLTQQPGSAQGTLSHLRPAWQRIYRSTMTLGAKKVILQRDPLHPCTASITMPIICL